MYLPVGLAVGDAVGDAVGMGVGEARKEKTYDESLLMKVKHRHTIWLASLYIFIKKKHQLQLLIESFSHARQHQEKLE